METDAFNFTPVMLAAITLRLTVGILFAFQGYEKVVRIGISGVVDAVGPAYKKLGFHDFSIRLISFLTSWIELLFGILFAVGFFTIPSAMFLCIDLIIVTAGMSMLDPAQDMKIIFPRLVLLVVYLLLAAPADFLTLDSLLRKWL